MRITFLRKRCLSSIISVKKHLRLTKQVAELYFQIAYLTWVLSLDVSEIFHNGRSQFNPVETTYITLFFIF